MFLSCFFCSKKTLEKRSIFCRKPGTNPFAKCRFFSTLWQHYFSGPESFIFYPEYQKMFLSGFFLLRKKHIRKRSIFWQKPWTNPFRKTSIFEEKPWTKYIKKCFFQLFLAQKKIVWEKGRFLDKNHGVTLCIMSFFFRLCENFIIEVQKTLFSIQNIKKCFFIAFCSKKIYKKKVDFLTKTMD